LSVPSAFLEFTVREGHVKVLDLPELDRPRERLLSQGAAALSDRELLALVLGSGRPGCDAIELAAVLIGESGGLPALATADPHVLKRLPGIGAAKAARVAASFELARRAAVAEGRRRIAGSADVAAVVAPYLHSLRHERVVVVACDNAGRLLRVAPLTDGSADRSLIPVRDVLTAVLAVGGTSFAVAHNHPSGSLTPSEPDTNVTVRLRRAAGAVGLRFLDHVILTETAWARVP
jgi:DNA repair protein RadC